jgi:hypothetical protein
VAANETFWEAVDSARLEGREPAGCMGVLGAHLAGSSDEYASRLGRALQVWAALF